MTHLRYETKGGNFSEGETFAQLTEYLRLASEACYVLGHHSKENHDTIRGDGFLKVGQNLEKVRELVTNLATRSRSAQ
jgi:hypothetical protein